jgi:hypothetical protein
MEKELEELVLRYNNMFRYADERFIMEAISIIINKLNIQEYLNDCYVIKDYSVEYNTIAEYLFYSKKIIFYVKKFNEYAINNIKNSSNIEEKIFTYNILIINVLLHEAEHANQIKQIYEATGWKKDVFFASIFHKFILYDDAFLNALKNYGIDNRFIENYYLFKEKNYVEYYDLAPEEKEANIFAAIITNNILSDIPNFQESAIYSLFKLKQIKYQAMGYNFSNTQVDSSTIRYLKEIKNDYFLPTQTWYKDDIYSSFIKCQSMPLIDRTTYGLPIHQLEYESLMLDYYNIKRKIKKPNKM